MTRCMPGKPISSVGVGEVTPQVAERRYVGAVCPRLFEPGKKKPPMSCRFGESSSTTRVEPAGAVPSTGTETMDSCCGCKVVSVLPIRVMLSYSTAEPASVYNLTVIGCVTVADSTPKDTDVTLKSLVMSKSSRVNVRRKPFSALPSPLLHETELPWMISCDTECVIVTSSAGVFGRAGVTDFPGLGATPLALVHDGP